jgi:hypothetical protein
MSQTFSWLRVAVTVVALVGCFIGLLIVQRHLLAGPPFVLRLEPDGEHATVQFVNPKLVSNNEIASPKFAIDTRQSAPFETKLMSSETIVPGGTIEFSDTTMLPGRFRIRFGNRVFDVMSSRIVVDGKDTDWLEQPRKL